MPAAYRNLGGGARWKRSGGVASVFKLGLKLASGFHTEVPLDQAELTAVAEVFESTE